MTTSKTLKLDEFNLEANISSEMLEQINKDYERLIEVNENNPIQIAKINENINQIRTNLKSNYKAINSYKKINKFQ